MPDIGVVAGLLVGHAGDAAALTGCTVVVCPEGAVAGCDVRGSAPGTRETDLLRPGRRVERVHAVLLTGGSAFGLDAAGGVMRFLAERGIGFPAGPVRVPIVPAAVLFDLGIGRSDVRPDAAMGYAACADAFARPPGAPLPLGNVGCGLGATVGKLRGMAGAMKGGVGSHALRLAGGVTVAALVAVNALGNVYDPDEGTWLAGSRDADGRPLDVERWLLGSRDPAEPFADGGHTTIGVVATDAALDKAQCNLLAQMAGVGLARSIFPVHTLADGDALFALATGRVAAAVDLTVLGAAAALAVGRAVADAVRRAEPAGGLPAARDLAGR